MARIRSIKPEFWTDRKLARVSRDGRLLYIALWNVADEWARIHGDVRYIKGQCLPYDDDLSLKDVERLLTELVKAGRVQRYVSLDDDPYLFLPHLAKHQRLEPHKTPSRLPAPPVTCGYEVGADESEKIPDKSAEIVVQQVASSRLQVAGSRGEIPAPFRANGGSKPSTTDQRVADGLALAERLRKQGR